MNDNAVKEPRSDRILADIAPPEGIFILLRNGIEAIQRLCFVMNTKRQKRVAG